MEYAISLQNITKLYNGLRAVDNISLEVGSGTIFGLLGERCGKTPDQDPRLSCALPCFCIDEGHNILLDSERSAG
jgi:ABC-type lipopolysaccharide export system ATPase subunit